MLFSPNVMNNTQEFDILSGLGELDDTQHAETSAMEDMALTSQVEATHCGKRLFKAMDLTLCAEDPGHSKRLPDPGGGGDSEKDLHPEDSYTELFSSQATQVTPANNNKTSEGLDTNTGTQIPTVTALPETVTSAGQDTVLTTPASSRKPKEIAVETGHKSLPANCNQRPVRGLLEKSTPTPVSSKHVDPVFQQSPDIDNFLSQILSTPPSRSSGRPAPRRARMRPQICSTHAVVSDLPSCLGSQEKSPKKSPAMPILEKVSLDEPLEPSEEMPVLEKEVPALDREILDQERLQVVSIVQSAHPVLQKENDCLTCQNVKDENQPDTACVEHDNDVQFTQLSPDALSAMLNAGRFHDPQVSNTPSNNSATPATSGTSIGLPNNRINTKLLFTPTTLASIERTPSNSHASVPAQSLTVQPCDAAAAVPEDIPQLSVTGPGAPQLAAASIPKLSVGRRRPQRFLYPTKNDIKESCPAAVYRLESVGAINEEAADSMQSVAQDSSVPSGEDNRPTRINSTPYLKRKLYSPGKPFLCVFI